MVSGGMCVTRAFSRDCCDNWPTKRALRAESSPQKMKRYASLPHFLLVAGRR